MSLGINLRHLEHKDVSLKGTLDPEELELDDVDELITIKEHLHYSLEARKMEQQVLVEGEIKAVLDCECSRCLKPFKKEVVLNPWICHLPLDGPEKVAVASDVVDLTPYLREDILLAFPQHPLCKVDCGGLPNQSSSRNQANEKTQADILSSTWSELNKLKF
jgi:uncharacterized protein